MPLAIRAGSLLDGTGQPPRRNVLILIEQNRSTVIKDGRIAADRRPVGVGEAVGAAVGVASS